MIAVAKASSFRKKRMQRLRCAVPRIPPENAVFRLRSRESDLTLRHGMAIIYMKRNATHIPGVRIPKGKQSTLSARIAGREKRRDPMLCKDRASCSAQDRLPTTKQQDILTLPNLLTCVRLALIPLFVCLYVIKENYLATALILLASGLTDIADGFIARRFHMVSDLGKMLDPMADKLTQLAMLACLVNRFPLMLGAVVLLVVKESVTGVFSLIVVKRTKVVKSAVWHGKLNTVLLYLMMVVHLVWYNIPPSASDVFISLCVVMMLVSFVAYTAENARSLLFTKAAKDPSRKENPTDHAPSSPPTSG